MWESAGIEFTSGFTVLGESGHDMPPTSTHEGAITACERDGCHFCWVECFCSYTAGHIWEHTPPIQVLNGAHTLCSAWIFLWVSRGCGKKLHLEGV